MGSWMPDLRHLYPHAVAVWGDTNVTQRTGKNNYLIGWPNDVLAQKKMMLECLATWHDEDAAISMVEASHRQSAANTRINTVNGKDLLEKYSW